MNGDEALLITTECYKETYLDGKNADGIKKEIESLRHGIEKLKMKIESPASTLEGREGFSPREELFAAREYLRVAKEVLFEISGEDAESEKEKAAGFINGRCENISRLTLTIGVYLTMKHTLDVLDRESILKVSELHGDEIEVRMDTERVMEEIRELRLGEWRDLYLPEHYGCSMSDAEKWRLAVEFKDGGAPIFFDGVGVYPYNFKSLCALMGAER